MLPIMHDTYVSRAIVLVELCSANSIIIPVLMYLVANTIDVMYLHVYTYLCSYRWS